MRFTNEEEITEIVRAFEYATINRDEWKHAEHLTVAMHYSTHYDLEIATTRMREGIFKLLGAFGVDLTKEMPYHETLTVFWMRTVSDFDLKNKDLRLLDRVNALIAQHDKDYPLRFYSRDRLFSDEARARYVEPDISDQRSPKHDHQS